jgi:hypothetical protein
MTTDVQDGAPTKRHNYSESTTQHRTKVNSRHGDTRQQSLHCSGCSSRRLDGTISFLDRQLDNLNKSSQPISWSHNNRTVLRFGPRTLHWLYGNIDRQFGNTGMSYYMTVQAWTGYPREN